MDFYYIRSRNELAPGCFGVLEPNPDMATLWQPEEGGLCLVPALCYDLRGYRLGYGKGYYDRFLAGFNGTAAGICYSNCIARRLPHGWFDRSAEIVVTENYIRRMNRA